MLGLELICTEEERMLKEQVAALLAAEAPPKNLRELIDNKEPWDASLWKSLAELGLLGAAIPEAHGGVGLGISALSVIAEEIGRCVAPVPFFSSACLASQAILLFGSDIQKRSLLSSLACGDAVGTFAWSEGSGTGIVGDYQCAYGSGRVTGIKTPVPNASIANLCIVLVRCDTDSALAVVHMDQPFVEITALDGFDELCHHASLRFAGARAELLPSSVGQESLLRFLARAAVVKAHEQIGGAEAALYMARDYSLERYTFGRQIGSYQAIKHKLARVLVEIELARSNALAAARSLGAGSEDLAPAAIAYLAATEAYEQAARENLQTHGGIGYTWEANCHFHYRRARLAALELGGMETWHSLLIDAISKSESWSNRTSGCL